MHKAHMAHVQKLQEDALKKAQEQRNYQRQLAANRLKQARDFEEKMVSVLNDTYQELTDSTYQLGEAKANLAKTKDEMELLCNKKLELVSPLPVSGANYSSSPL
jgi:hypothetical protein